MLWKCHSDYLRRKLLEVGPELTLARTLELAGQCEELDTQMAMLSVDRNSTAAVISQVNNNDSDWRQKDSMPTSWRNAKRQQMLPLRKAGHFGRDQCCPARGKTCNLCGGKKIMFPWSVKQTKNRPKGGYIPKAHPVIYWLPHWTA